MRLYKINKNMAFYHYFSKNADKRAKFIFNFIAPVYSRANRLLADNFEKAIKLISDKEEYQNKKIIDIGTGTGAWIATLNKELSPAKASGTDFSEKMLKQAKKKYKGIDFFYGNGENLSNIPDNTYDIATASFVLHGVKADKRTKILNEMTRIASEKLIFQDFIGKTPTVLKVLEFLEQSDYKNFKKNFCNELQNKYKDCYSKYIRAGTGLYIVDLKKYKANENLS